MFSRPIESIDQSRPVSKCPFSGLTRRPVRQPGLQGGRLNNPASPRRPARQYAPRGPTCCAAGTHFVYAAINLHFQVWKSPFLTGCCCSNILTLTTVAKGTLDLLTGHWGATLEPTDYLVGRNTPTHRPLGRNTRTHRLFIGRILGPTEYW